MPALTDWTLYCVICGGPIWGQGDYDYGSEYDWLSSTELLFEDAGEAQGTLPQVTHLPATNKGGSYFKFTSKSGIEEYTNACDVGILSPFVRNKPRLYLPLHVACLAISNEMATSVLNITPEIMLRKMWSTLWKRFRKQGLKYPVVLKVLYPPNSFYGMGWFQGEDWEPGEEGSDLAHHAEYYTSDPTESRDLTSALLSNLEPVPSIYSTETSMFMSHASKLPHELIHKILSCFKPFSQSTRSCNYQIPAIYWKQALLDGSILPWLPKLDPTIVESKEGEEGTITWDWEKLARQLGGLSFKEGPIEMEAEGFPVPMGLWNRRRIWQLLEEILIDEV